jgi:ethanolamine permease
MVDTTVTTTSTATAQQSHSLNLLKVLGPAHVWALGVGIVLVGEFMGWNYAAGKGGAFGALIACFVSGILYTCVAKIDSEVTSTVASAGGQYAQAKHTIGPLMAFNVGLFMTLTYLMLNAGDVLVAGQLVQIGAQQLGHDIPWQPFTVFFLAILTLLNYRGVLATLTVNFVITAAAFASIIILFIGVKPWAPGEVLLHKELLTALPYGWIGVIAALHFGMWFYLGIEGTCQAAEEVRSPGRALPLGTMSGIITLLIAAAITWYVACGLMPWEYIGWDATLAPLYDSARMTGSPVLIVILFIGTLLSAIASSNGCTNDQARAWFAMGRDRYLPEWFAGVHPKYRTPFRSILFLTPIVLIFALYIPLAQIITFSILSGLLNYTFMPINMWNFRRKWPLGSIRRGFSHPFHPMPAITLLVLCAATFFAVYLGYGRQLLAMMAFYIVASLWFAFYRYRYVKRGAQFTMPWPRPAGY